MRVLQRFAERSIVLVACVAGFLAPSRSSGQNVAQTVHLEMSLTQQDFVLERQFVQPSQTLITRVSLRVREAASQANDPGFPILPYFIRRVALPAGSQIQSLQVTPGQGIPFQGVGLIAWAQIPQAGRDPQLPVGPDGQPEFVFYGAPDAIPLDPSMGQVQVWPPEMVEVADVREVAGHDVFTFHIYPFQWRPFEDALVLQTPISLDLSYVSGMPPRPGSYAEAMALEALKKNVDNPGAIIDPRPHSFPPGPDTRYLIITDNYRWSPDFTRGSHITGGMLSEFERLALWKTEKGLKASVVTISNILRGDYGDFRTGARDLQEALRNFLKFAYRNWSTYWVLIGGNVEVVPAREVAANNHFRDGNFFYLLPAAIPKLNRCFYDGVNNSVRIHSNEDPGVRENGILPDDGVIAERTGKVFHRVTPGTMPGPGNPGWTYTEGAYESWRHGPNGFVLLSGPREDIEHSHFYTVRYSSTIPTDLYYASLVSPGSYDLPGLHDWDRNDNGLYGQYSWRKLSESPFVDGTSFTATVMVGRAPVSEKAQARAFVDKVIAYERYEGAYASFGRTALFGADSWYGGPAVGPTATYPPETGKYHTTSPSSTMAQLRFKGATTGRLIAWNDASDWWEVPYNLSANGLTLGYYYAVDDGYVDPSVHDLGSGTTIPLPTAYVRVLGPAAQVHPGKFFFDDPSVDPAVTEKDAVKELLGLKAPGLDVRRRLYFDFIDTPDCLLPSVLAPLSETSMRSALNSGYNVVSLSGHGWWGGCCGVNAGWISGLTNGFAGGLIYADSCLTNEFNKPKAKSEMDDAVSELIVKSPTGGAAAYIGNSRFSIIGLGAEFERRFWESLAVNRRVGIAHQSKEYLLHAPNHRWVNYSLNLMGDPEMAVWLGKPEQLIGTHPSIVFQGDALQVRVTDPAGAFIKGAVVCVSGPGGFYLVSESDDFGLTVFPTAAAPSGSDILVTATRLGYIPYRGAVEVKLLFRRFIRADSNFDGRLDISDGIATLGYLFLGTREPDCLDAADANDDGRLDIGDAITTFSYLFLGGDLPAGTIEGQPQDDSTPDNLGC